MDNAGVLVGLVPGVRTWVSIRIQPEPPGSIDSMLYIRLTVNNT
jgi:hypothetical protein